MKWKSSYAAAFIQIIHLFEMGRVSGIHSYTIKLKNFFRWFWSLDVGLVQIHPHYLMTTPWTLIFDIQEVVLCPVTWSCLNTYFEFWIPANTWWFWHRTLTWPSASKNPYKLSTPWSTEDSPSCFSYTLNEISKIGSVKHCFARHKKLSCATKYIGCHQ